MPEQPPSGDAADEAGGPADETGVPADETGVPADETGVPADLDVGLGVAAVARRLGVAAGTLRTWDRRYGVGPTGHVAGSHRRYTAEDLGRLDLMRRLMLEGVTPAEAAGAALERPVGTDPTLPPHPPTPPANRRAARRRRAGGGRVVPLREASPATRGLARAAMAMDSVACANLIAASLSRRGVVPTWTTLVLPVLNGLGERWRATGTGVEVEHLFAECVEDAFRAVPRRLARPLNTRPMLLAGIETEEHRLPLHALAAGLAERSVVVRMLGPRLPGQALAEAISRTGAAAVFLWAQVEVTPAQQLTSLQPLPRVRPAATVILGGPGWRPDELPGTVRWVPDLASAVGAMVESVGLASDTR